MKKLLGLAFMSMRTVSMTEFNIKGRLDEYQSFHFEKGAYLNSFLDEPQKFKSEVAEFLQLAKQKCKAVWVQLDVSQIALAQSLLDLGFEMHHCTENYLLLSQWLLDEPSRLPSYTTHYVGAGGLVLKGDSFLAIQEKNGDKRGYWAIPGGLVDTNELVIEAAIREVKEETQLDVEAKDVLIVRELLDANFNKSDIYFVVITKMLNENQEVKICQNEILDYKWIKLTQIDDVYDMLILVSEESQVITYLIEIISIAEGIQTKTDVYYIRTPEIILRS